MKNINMDKAGFISNIKARYLQGELTRDEAKEIIRSSYKNITAQEFAMGEQELSNLGVSEDEITRRLPEIMDIFEEFLVADPLGVEQGHPLDSYQKEIDIFKETFRQLERLSKNKFIMNPYLEQYDKLKGLKIHLDRKQNQLYSALEKAGFDMPSKIMWTLDNALQKTVKEAVMALLSGEETKFLEINQQVIDQGLDLMSKEENILLPTALELIDDEEFVQMRQGDDEIGYALISNPPGYKNSHQSAESAAIENAPGGFIQELGALLSKYQMGNPEEELDVAQGKLSLERINLIFKHLPVDLSYVDENEIVKFYSDTKERVFPRSPGVIGRKVQNCHPRESVDTVEEIIKAFRNNEQDQAEFWLPMGDQFIYIIYIAVRDEKGQFKGVLEMMQNATRVRSLEGKQTLLSWGIAPKSDTMAVDTVEQTAKDKTDDSKENQQQPFEDSAHHNEKDSDSPLSKETILGELLKRYPGLKDHLLTLSPKYNKLNNPLIFNAMKNVATLEMIAHRGGFQVEELIDLIQQWINNQR